MMRRDYLGDFSSWIDADLDEMARRTREDWHVNCEWIMATPAAAPGLGYETMFNSDQFEKSASLGDFDLLREYLPHAKRHGVHLVPYVNMHWYSYEFAARHPGWEQVLEDGVTVGERMPLYGGGTTLCVNSPWRDWAFEMIREVMRTGVDGVFLDGPLVFTGACYCEHCRRLFAKTTRAGEMPIFNDWSDPLWPEFQKFRTASLARYLGDAQSAVREIKPDGVIFLNGGRFITHAANRGTDASHLQPYQTFTGAEEFFHCQSESVLPYRSLNLSRHLSAGQNPAVVFTHHALGAWHYNPLPRAEMTIAMSQSAAGGSNTWFAIFMDSMTTRSEEAFAAVKSVGTFLEKNESCFTGTTSAAETAALFSYSTLYSYVTRHTALCRDAGSGKEEDLSIDLGGPQQKGNATQRRKVSADILDHESPGCLDVCNFSHVPVRVVWEEHLTSKDLKGIKTLILPNSACLSDKHIRAIQDFVENGGGLVATFESGMYNEFGHPVARRNWLRFLGITRVEGVFVPAAYEEYLTLSGHRIKTLPPKAMIPRPLNALKVRSTRDAEVLGFYNNPIGKVYLKPQGISRYPAILMSKRGKGRVAYVASPVFESFERYHVDDHKDVVRDLIGLVSGRRDMQVETDAPGSLAIEVRKQKGRTLVHLLNVTSDMKRPMGTIIPLRNIEISFRARNIAKARCLGSDRTLTIKKDGDRIHFRVPVVNEYEVVALTHK